MSVVIPCGYAPEGLSTTLESLHACEKPPCDWEVIVGNDGGDTDVSSVAAEYGATEVVLPQNRGPAAARNRAIEASAGEVIAMIDCDLVLGRDWLIEVWRAGSTFDYAGGHAVTNRRLIRSIAHRYDAITAFDLERHLKSDHYAESLNLIVRRTLFERIGGFDERLRSSHDHELGDRAYRMGATQGYWPQARVEHPPRGFRQQFFKHRRIMMAHTVMNEIWPGRFTGQKPGVIRILRLISPPRRVGRSDARITEFGVLQVPLFYTIAWASKLVMLYHLLAIRFGGRRARNWGDFEPRGDRATG